MPARLRLHKADAQRINIKWRAWPQERLAEARLALAEYTKGERVLS